ncbi:hypothetical protein MHB42_15035 [Lysinibacillus sp. FSL K6-0232]|uniref:hypothetical protein n=1 Tax=Lysinibacillus sp. FSL K6-0232 TaxID=2921425 RepID=UPI0030F8DDC4
MLICKKKGKLNKILKCGALAVMLGVAGSAYAAGTSTAYIPVGSSSATGSNVTATGTSGTLTVTSSGPVFYVQGYAKVYKNWWPDTIKANLIANPGTSTSTSFTTTSGEQYYAQANTQANTTQISGSAKVTVK